MILIDKVKVSEDPFGANVYEDRRISVDNVLVSPTVSDDVVNSLNLYGKKAVYTLGIPKGDKNSWEDKEVIFFNQRFRVFGKVIEGISDLIPLDWNKKAFVEVIE